MPDWRRLGWLLAVLSTALAAPPEIEFEPGFARWIRPDQPVPIRLRVGAVDGPAKGTLELPLQLDDAGQPAQINTLELDVPAGGTKTYWMVVWPDDYTAELSFVYRSGGGIERSYATTVKPLGDSTRLLAVVDPTRAGLGFLRSTPPPPTATESSDAELAPAGREVANLKVDDLPPRAMAYRGLDALVLTGSEITAAPREVREAMATWVRHGGHLVLVGGPAAAGLWQDEVIADLSPVRVRGLTAVSRHDLEPLLTRYGGRFEDTGERFAISEAEALDGEVQVAVGGHPFLVHGSVGLGRVTFLAADFATPPLQGWTAQEAMWTDLLATDPPGWRFSRNPSRSALRNLAAVLPGVQTPALAVVAGFLLLYLIVLIPVQFPLLKKLGRRELAWLTTPLIVLVFSLGAFFLGLGLKGRDLVFSTAALVEAEAGRLPALLHGVTAIHSPAKDAWRVEFPPDTGRLDEMPDTIHDYPVWSDEPEVASSRLRLLQTPAGPVLEALPIEMWAMRLFAYDAWIELPGTVEVTADLVDGVVRATVTHQLPLPLEQAVLAAGATLAPLGTIRPGESKTVEQRLGRSPQRPDSREDWTLAEYLGQFTPRDFEPKLVAEAATVLVREAYQETGEEVDSRPDAALWAWVEGAPSLPRVTDRSTQQRQLWLLRVPVEVRGLPPH